MPRHRSSLEEYLVAVGDKIRRTRIQRGYTLEEVGRDIGLDKSNMYRIEQGRNITLLTLLKIAVVLEVDPNDLIKNNVEVELSDLEKFLRAKQRRRASWSYPAPLPRFYFSFIRFAKIISALKYALSSKVKRQAQA